MAQLTVERAMKLSKRAKSRKSQWDSMLEEAYELVMPNRNTLTDHTPGADRSSQNWDGTAAQAIVSGADRLMEFVPAFQDWIVLEPGPAAKAMLPQEELSKLELHLGSTAKMCNAMVSHGGFHTSAHEMFQDFLVSTGGMIVNDTEGEPTGGLCSFGAMPLSQFMVDEGPDGSVIRRYRWFEIEGEELAGYWKDAKLSDDLKRQISDKPDKKISILEMEYLDRQNGPKRWRYEVFVLSSRKADQQRIVERTDTTAAMLTPRYSKTAGESLGRGPVLTSLPDIRTVNKIVELTFRAAALNLLGVWTAVQSDEVNVSALQIVPGAVIGVPSNGGPRGPSLQRLDTGQSGVQFADVLSDDMRMNIKRALLDSRLPPDAGPVRSATEIAARMRELSMDLGGAYGRLMQEFVVPLVQRLVSILFKRGMIPGEMEIDQFFVNVTVSSPLAREQKLSDLNDIVQWLTILRDLGGRELMMLGAMLEDVGEHIAKLLGVDPKLIRPENGAKGRNEMQKNMGLGLAAGVKPPPDVNAAGIPAEAIQQAA